MTKNKTKKHNNLKRITLTLLILTMLNACSTTNRKQILIQRSIEQQNVTLKLIKEQRSNMEFQNELGENKKLRLAELQLEAAIDSIIESNNAIKEKLPKNKKEKGENNE